MIKKLRSFFSTGKKKRRKEKSLPGLIMIQIDGLSRTQFEKALKEGNVPFISSLYSKSDYSLYSLYSGLPSSTPAVQAELFYGQCCAVPGFGFMNRKKGEYCSMLSAKTTVRIQKKLSSLGISLLQGGSAYCDIYNHGAIKSKYCSPDMGTIFYLNILNPFNALYLLTHHIFMVFRISFLLFIELFLAIFDFFRGVVLKESLWREISFIPARAGICVLLRELITANVTIDTVAGYPVIHCNLLGYDEQAHRRGPSSAFAHWTLKGIDQSVRRICKAAMRSKKRRYNVWIYSDHGQEYTKSYSRTYKKSVHRAVAELLEEIGIKGNAPEEIDETIQLKRIALLRGRFFKKLLKTELFKGSGIQEPRIVAIGPIGHLYLPRKLPSSKMEQIGSILVQRAFIPLVMRSEKPGVVRAWNREGEWVLPGDIKRVAGDNHPYIDDLSADLVKLVEHPDSGDFVLSGWVPRGEAISFPVENGAHAGPGREETNGFALLPEEIIIRSKKEYIRPLHLREAAIDLLYSHRSPPAHSE